jgi:hypothetical protein
VGCVRVFGQVGGRERKKGNVGGVGKKYSSSPGRACPGEEEDP